MDTLPYVVLRETAQYLSDQDLAAWSATSRNLREVLNDNQLWRPRCDPLLAEYLRNTECQVEPYFQSPEIEGSGLSPICEWRLCFMRQVHLWNNWRNDRHFEQDMSETLPNTRGYEFYQNEFLIGIHGKVIELWNVRRSPVLVCREPLLSSVYIVIFLQAYRDKLVLMQYKLVQVFQISISRGELVFLHSFYCDQNEKNLAENFDRTKLPMDLSEIQEDSTIWINNLVGSTLIGGIFVAWSQDSSQILHVWDAETGVKVKEIDIGQTEYARISHRSDSDKSYLNVLRGDEEGLYSALVYFIKDFTQIFKSRTYFIIPSDISVIQGFVLIALDNVVDIYSLKTAQHILKVDTKKYVERITLHSVGNSVFFSAKVGTLMKYSPRKAKIETITIENGQPLENSPRGMFFLNERYIITNTNWIDGIFHLNEVKDDRVIQRHTLTLEPGLSANVRRQFMNESATKFIVEGLYVVGSGYKGSRIVTVW